MRRIDREVTDPEFYDYVFAKALEIFLALRDGEYPYCVPLNFVREGNTIYMHSAREGRKLDIIRANGHAAFSLACDVKILPEKNSTCYKSVCGRGFASIVEDRKEKKRALDALAERYNARCPRPASDASIASVAIIRLDIQEMTGKAHREKNDSLHP